MTSYAQFLLFSSTALLARAVNSSSRTTQRVDMRAASRLRVLLLKPRRLPAAYSTFAKPFLLADIGEGITGCEIVKWLVKPGQTVAEFDPIAEVQSDKATVEITSPYEGVIQTLVGQTGEVVKVGEPLCMILVEADSDQQPSTSTTTTLGTVQEQKNLASDSDQENNLTRVQTHSTPSVRRLAREHDLDITDIRGTGKQGRVTKEDVINYLKQMDSSHQPINIIAGKSSFEQPAPTTTEKSIGNSRPIKEPFGVVRQAMFRAMSQSLKIPHFGYSDQIDVTELEQFRQVLIKNYPTPKITLLSLFIKILGKSMDENPIFKSTLSIPTQQDSTTVEPSFITRSQCDISIAVNSPAGLLTPLIPSVNSKSILQIAQHITDLRSFIDQSSPDRIPRIPDHLGGNRSGTLTISNIGNIGGTYTHPVIPPTGQLVIGAIGTIRVVPEYAPQDKQTAKAYAIDPTATLDIPLNQLRIVPRLVVEVSFTADHRAVEGVELATFVTHFKRLCNTPDLLLANLV
ncbi:hypothetical protein MJO29_007772 [Puccinia striiformis f. sp. tritici]|nr:hypothetical protein MJO29_007772 [Puccinia striiformis f. sp. tritici]